MPIAMTSTGARRRRRPVGAMQSHALAALTLNLAAQRLRKKEAAARTALLVPAGSGTMDLGAHVGRLCAALSEELEVRLSLKTEEICLDGERCRLVGLIISELVRNATRNAVKERREVIQVALSGWGDNVRCLVTSTRSAPSARRDSDGHRLVRASAAKLGASVDWWSNDRECFTGVHFPLEGSIDAPP